MLHTDCLKCVDVNNGIALLIHMTFDTKANVLTLQFCIYGIMTTFWMYVAQISDTG